MSLGVHYLHQSQEYFAERPPIMFDIILQYAYTGHLNRPSFICAQSLEDELKLWRLESTRSPMTCCANTGLAGSAMNGNSTNIIQNSRKEKAIKL